MQFKKKNLCTNLFYLKKKTILGSIHYSIGFNKDQQIKPFFYIRYKSLSFFWSKSNLVEKSHWATALKKIIKSRFWIMFSNKNTFQNLDIKKKMSDYEWGKGSACGYPSIESIDWTYNRNSLILIIPTNHTLTEPEKVVKPTSVHQCQPITTWSIGSKFLCRRSKYAIIIIT